jgi:hypothetical protein
VVLFKRENLIKTIWWLSVTYIAWGNHLGSLSYRHLKVTWLGLDFGALLSRWLSYCIRYMSTSWDTSATCLQAETHQLHVYRLRHISYMSTS